jgi:hypothetical protein
MSIPNAKQSQAPSSLSFVAASGGLCAIIHFQKWLEINFAGTWIGKWSST